jgi:hypothetical protein
LNYFNSFCFTKSKILTVKTITIIILLFFSGIGSVLHAQEYTNYISCKVDGKEWKAEARRMKIPVSGFEYLALAAFQVSPDVQVWIRLYYFAENLKPGSYPILTEENVESESRKKADHDLVWVLVDYTSETKGLGYAFHDGESLSGTLTIDKVNKTSIEGSFTATLSGVTYKKRAFAAVTGGGIRSNIENKAITKAGGGMLVNGGPHDHDNTKKAGKTDPIVLSDGEFHVDWSKTEKEGK